MSRWDPLARRTITPLQGLLLDLANQPGAIVRVSIQALDRRAVFVLGAIGVWFRRSTFNAIRGHFGKPAPVRVNTRTVAYDYQALPLDAPISSRAAGPKLRIASSADR